MMELRNRVTEMRIIRADELQGRNGNWRTHPKFQRDALRGVLESIGISGALTAYHSERQGGLTLIDGHLRKEDYSDTGWPTLVLDVNDAEADVLLATLDPIAALAEAESDALAALLATVETESEAVRALLERLAAQEGIDLGGELVADPGAQIDKAAELQEKWQVKTGDLWEIGAHRLICGDCTDAGVVGQVMGGEKAGAAVTDPPYGINRKGIVNDDPEGLRVLFDGALAVMPIRDAVVIAFQSPRLFPVWLDAVRAAGHKFERALWFYDETDITFPWHGWLMTSQMALVSSLGLPQWALGAKCHHDCYIVKTAGQQDNSGGHMAVKPLDVIQDLVSHTRGDVYDPFLGSGTTAVACEQLHRRCFGIEIEPKYCAVTLERLAICTGVNPVLVDS